VQWDPSAVERSPPLFAFAPAAAPLRRCLEWPGLHLLQDLCEARRLVTARGMPVRLTGERSAEPYETRLLLRAEMHVRSGEWHDLFNVLAWLTYPCVKAALNARHHEEATRCGANSADRGRRTPTRDALTLFDEGGVIVAASDPALLDMIRAFEWKTLFWTCRARFLEHVRVFVIGHALAGKLLAPYVGLTAHAVLLPVTRALTHAPLSAALEEIDARVTELVRSGPAFEAPRTLSPLPVLGVPGWFAASACETFYDDAAYFRPARSARPGKPLDPVAGYNRAAR
jgi:hypothetical protein